MIGVLNREMEYVLIDGKDLNEIDLPALGLTGQKATKGQDPLVAGETLAKIKKAEIARKFISMLSSNLYKAENLLLELAYQSVRQRVATALTKLNSQNDSGKNPFIISVARKDISSMVGTSTESLNRTLADFKDEGLIEISDKGLRVLNLAKLEHART